MSRPRKMLFLHGMQSRYDDTSSAQVEADARRYAEARGYDLEVIDISGDDRAAQLKEARSRLREGGYGGVVGFSAGGATADQLRKEFPDLDITSVSTGGDGRGGIYFPGVPHMGQMGALANKPRARLVPRILNSPPFVEAHIAWQSGLAHRRSATCP